MAKRSAGGLPLIEKKRDECAAGGEHEDLPYVRELTLADSPDKLIEFYCLKCRLVHWAVFPPPEQKSAPTEPDYHDENELLDGLPHA